MSVIHRFVEKHFLGILFSMHFNLPKNDSKYYWTQHSVRKMMFYGLTADKVKRIIKSPKRVETGVAENTIAVMQSTGTGKKPTEVWVMYANATNHRLPTTNDKNKSLGKLSVVSSKLLVDNFLSRKIIISAWRYPGISPVGKQIPIPADILEELKKEGIMVE
ncbi:MAG: hypothetical protein A3J46_01325 [Candidatus Yanofskybacteria bacterium RIFCSPHIGHO2_02_FULL_41_11]|uniref:Uncharacterized protein n=1 Tax=Candidatus Yanofskybacteria bacterium RIFCSPHIGHO2_02_FULL_41_11 TaxID=1802675 RepID=A0A1F8F8F2_9BACT|nr:MAG: hypothetical protein A3J46_01325 [Candidatus Yanofskybacteria bacterium RIFCSPHIGHO2_02_FULL_41_11]